MSIIGASPFRLPHKYTDMETSTLQDGEVHIWVSSDGAGKQQWHKTLDWIHAAETSKYSGKTSTELTTKLVAAKKLTLFCLSRGQKIGIGMGETMCLPARRNAIEAMLDPKTLGRIQGNPPEQRHRIISLLYYQRVALAHALELKGPYRLWRVNPLFIRGDYNMDKNDGNRTVGGFLLKTLSLGNDYISVLCCSPLTGKVVVRFL